jgi:flavin reductase (DIM6/NTAB) family NADH-FMN oxidoreductase RutF
VRDKALHHLPYALLVIGSLHGKSIVTIVANWAMQVSFAPSLLAIAIERDSRMRESIEASGFFSVNFLPADRPELAKNFLKPRAILVAEFAGTQFTPGKNGSPFLHEALASLECKVVHVYPTGDHITFIGEVLDARADREGEVLTLQETGLRYRH